MIKINVCCSLNVALKSITSVHFKQCGKILPSKYSTIYELERSFEPNRSKGNVSEERPTLAAALWAIVSTIVAQTVLQAEVAASYLPLLNSKKELRRETEAPTTMDAQRAKALLIIPVRRRYALNERVDVVRHWGPCKGMPMHCLTPSRSGDVGSGIAKRFVLLSRE
ncbi:hypothetical protein V1478_016551 [Vespula squamosa]|uniref:Uncharacterized protein n=1 Tax=Vespula squamosa TaxID=30214 RepID=A0ABD2A066_VESSQ